MAQRQSKEIGPGRVERDQRRDEILKAATVLFHERGYHGTSLDDIGAVLGITGPAIYRHFKTKQGLLLAAIREGSAAHLRSAEDAEGLPPLEALRALVTSYVDVAIQYRDSLGIYRQERRYLPASERHWVTRDMNTFVDTWARVLQALRPDLTAEEVIGVVHAAIGLLSSSVQLRIPVPPERLPTLLKQMGFGALMAVVMPGETAGRLDLDLRIVEQVGNDLLSPTARSSPSSAAPLGQPGGRK